MHEVSVAKVSKDAPLDKVCLLGCGESREGRGSEITCLHQKPSSAMISKRCCLLGNATLSRSPSTRTHHTGWGAVYKAPTVQHWLSPPHPPTHPTHTHTCFQAWPRAGALSTTPLTSSRAPAWRCLGWGRWALQSSRPPSGLGLPASLRLTPTQVCRGVWVGRGVPACLPLTAG